MGKRLTPIERAIAGEPTDRRRRYDAKMRAQGFTKITVMVRPEDGEILKRLSELSRTLPREEFEQLLQDALQTLQDAAAAPQQREDRTRRPARPEARL